MTQEEFAALALGHLEDLTAFARHLSRNPADADDLVQGASLDVPDALFLVRSTWAARTCT